jgi:chorismate mutase-like protein
MLVRSIILLLALSCISTVPALAQQPVLEASAVSLEPLRRLIDDRLALMHDVARHKWNTGSSIDDLPREQRLIEALKGQAQSLGIPGPWAEHFFRAQIDGAKQVQRAHFARWVMQGENKFAEVPDLVTVIRPRLDALTPQFLRVLAAAWPVLADPAQRKHVRAAMATLANGTPEAAATVIAPLIDGSAYAVTAEAISK